MPIASLDASSFDLPPTLDHLASVFSAYLPWGSNACPKAAIKDVTYIGPSADLRMGGLQLLDGAWIEPVMVSRRRFSPMTENRRWEAENFSLAGSVDV